MAIVDFSKIEQVWPASATPINAGGLAQGATTVEDRPTLYDDCWGYFLFGQSVGFEYRDTNVYQNVTTFTIEGTFTRAAEIGGEGDSDATYAARDEEAFRAITAKYDALAKIFETAANAKAPTDYQEWGTSDDPRCIPLPTPLLDKNGKTVYAIPVGIQIDKTQFPILIKYRATLREAVQPMAKLMLNGVVIDDGVVNITIPQPIFATHPIVGTSGAILQLKYYKTMEIDASGSLPLDRVDQSISGPMKDLAASLEAGKLTLSAMVGQDGEVSTEDLWSGLDVVDDPNVDGDYSNRVMTVSVKARE